MNSRVFYTLIRLAVVCAALGLAAGCDDVSTAELKTPVYKTGLKDSDDNKVTETNPPMPTHATVGNDDGGRIDFGKVTYTAANVGHTYWYQMREDRGDNACIAYDEATYLIKVEVGSQTGADNNLIVTSNTTYYKQNENGAWQPVDINTGDDVDSKITFTNTLTPTSTSASLWVCKILEGRDWMDGDKFTFKVTPIGDSR